MNNDLLHYIKTIPKCELHLHIEGSFEPELMFEIAKRNNVEIPYKSVEEVREAYNFHNLQSFLDIYYAGATVLLHEKDFYDLTMAYMKRIHQDNVIHTEIFFDPQTHTDRGVHFDTVINGIHQALLDAKKDLGISSKLIMSYLRHLSEDDAIETLQMAIPHRDKIEAVGLDSSEVGNPPEKFKKVFQMSRELGFRTVAHAGEEGPTEYIWNSLNQLAIERIDHGVRSIEDDQLMTYIIDKEIPLTVCPLSNIKLCVFDKMENHNIKTMLDKGVKVTINSDDPSYFGGYMVDNFVATTNGLNLSKKDIFKICENSFEASFLSRQEKDVYLRELDQFRIS